MFAVKVPGILLTNVHNVHIILDVKASAGTRSIKVFWELVELKCFLDMASITVHLLTRRCTFTHLRAVNIVFQNIHKSLVYVEAVPPMGCSFNSFIHFCTHLSKRGGGVHPGRVTSLDVMVLGFAVDEFLLCFESSLIKCPLFHFLFLPLCFSTALISFTCTWLYSPFLSLNYRFNLKASPVVLTRVLCPTQTHFCRWPFMSLVAS